MAPCLPLGAWTELPEVARGEEASWVLWEISEVLLCPGQPRCPPVQSSMNFLGLWLFTQRVGLLARRLCRQSPLPPAVPPLPRRPLLSSVAL